jgi:hypothetical protein
MNRNSEIKQYRKNMIDTQYIPCKFRFKYNYITKKDLVDILFPNETIRKKDKLLKRANFFDMYSNNSFFTPKTFSFTTCPSYCDHKDGYGYCDSIMYEHEILVLNTDQFIDKVKDIEGNFYWINRKEFEPFRYIF